MKWPRPFKLVGGTRRAHPPNVMKRSVQTPTPSASRRSAANHVELLRMRMTVAENAWKQAKEHAALAKRRRKLAKLLARRAKKEARLAKENLDELREAIGKAQTRAATARKAAAPRSPRPKSAPANAKKRPTNRASVRKKPSPKDDLSKSPSPILSGKPESASNNPAAPVSPADSEAGEIHANT